MSESDIRVILAAIARLETKVDGLQDENKKADELHNTFASRITRLEQFKWAVLGAAGASAGAAGATIAKLLGS